MNTHKIHVLLLTALSMVVFDAIAQIEITPRGRFHLDFAAHDEDERELGDKFRIRRTRLGLTGRVHEDWQFMLEYDFAEDGTTANDIYLRYTGFSAGELTIGHFKVPFGFEEMGSTNNLPVIERALPSTTFNQTRRVGIGWTSTGDNWGLSLMGFGQGSGSAVRSDDSADEGLGVGGRFWFNPVLDDTNMLHLGIAATWEEPESSQAEEVRFRTRPESRPTGARLVDTGAIDNVDDIVQVALEAAYRRGPWSIQGEWMRSDVSRKGTSPDVDFSGWYVSTAWLLTGETRTYRAGTFRGVTPGRPTGAWELVARFSTVDLDDGPILGGEQDNITVGVNWYVNPRVRFMGNVIFVDSQRQGIDDDPVIFLTRAQIAF